MIFPPLFAVYHLETLLMLRKTLNEILEPILSAPGIGIDIAQFRKKMTQFQSAEGAGLRVNVLVSKSLRIDIFVHGFP
jgi:hypothetical protein